MGEIDLDEMVGEPHLEDEEVDYDGNQIPKERKVNYKTEKARQIHFFGQEVDCGSKYSFAYMLKSSLRNSQDLNHVLFEALKVRGGVKMRSHLLGYGDLRAFDSHNEVEFCDFEKNFCGIRGNFAVKA